MYYNGISEADKDEARSTVATTVGTTTRVLNMINGVDVPSPACVFPPIHHSNKRQQPRDITKKWEFSNDKYWIRNKGIGVKAGTSAQTTPRAED